MRRTLGSSWPSDALRAARATSAMRFLISSWDHSDIARTTATKKNVPNRKALRTSAMCWSRFVASTLPIFSRTRATWIAVPARRTTTASTTRVRVEESLPPTRISVLCGVGTDSGTGGPFTTATPDSVGGSGARFSGGAPPSCLGRLVEQALHGGDLVLEGLVAVAPLVELEDRVDARQAELERHRMELADQREDVRGLALERGAHRVQDVAD